MNSTQTANTLYLNDSPNWNQFFNGYPGLQDNYPAREAIEQAIEKLSETGEKEISAYYGCFRIEHTYGGRYRLYGRQEYGLLSIGEIEASYPNVHREEAFRDFLRVNLQHADKGNGLHDVIGTFPYQEARGYLENSYLEAKNQEEIAASHRRCFSLYKPVYLVDRQTYQDDELLGNLLFPAVKPEPGYGHNRRRQILRYLVEKAIHWPKLEKHEWNLWDGGGLVITKVARREAVYNVWIRKGDILSHIGRIELFN